MELKECTVVVTGGGTGIGRGIALGFAAEGSTVAVVGRRVGKLRETAALAGDADLRCFPADVSDPASVDETFDEIARRMGSVDVLVNSAGINVRRRSLAEVAPEDWERMLRINATGAFLALRAVLPEMRRRGDGLIVNISSVAGLRAFALAGAGYCASKFAMTALGTFAGLELREEGVRVTNIYPGEVETPILDERPEPVSTERRARMLQPEDVAAAVLMVARLPARAHVPDLVIKPTVQEFA